jgi:hypothetical protein
MNLKPDEFTALVEKIRRDSDGQFGCSIVDVEKLIRYAEQLQAAFDPVIMAEPEPLPPLLAEMLSRSEALERGSMVCGDCGGIELHSPQCPSMHAETDE